MAQEMSGAKKVGIGLGAAAVLAAGAVGMYMLYGPNGEKRRKQVKSWILKLKADVLEKIEDAKEVNEDTYSAIVQSVAKKYEQLKNIDPIELATIVQEMIKSWQSMKKEARNAKDMVAGKKRTIKHRVSKTK